MVEGLEDILASVFAVGPRNQKRRSGAGHFAASAICLVSKCDHLQNACAVWCQLGVVLTIISLTAEILVASGALSQPH